jgi:hypothetical protein
MNFSINSDVSSKSNVKPQLAGNRIVTATFEGVEYKEVISKTDGKQWNLITMKFSNDEGSFEDSTFEPKAGDDKRTTSDQGFLNVSVVEELMAKFRHLIAAVNPDLDAQIEKKEKTLNAPSWKALGTLMQKATQKGVGKPVQIKLMADKEGHGVFPRYFLGISKAEKPYMKTNFIAAEGGTLLFTDKEKERMTLVAAAKPTPMQKPIDGLDDIDVEIDPSAQGDGLDFDLEDL